MNRLFFRPEQCGMTKTDAAAQVAGWLRGDAAVLACSTWHLGPPWAPGYCPPPCLALPRQTLAGINPDVALESYTMNITTLEVRGTAAPPQHGAAVLQIAD